MKKTLIILLSITALIVIFRFQPWYVHVKGSDFCYQTTKTDYVTDQSGVARAYQNKYMVIESKGFINYIFPYSKTKYIPNPDDLLSCDNNGSKNILNDKAVDQKPQTPKPSDAESDLPSPPKTNTTTTTTYICDSKVKVVTEQDSPSLPPRISYMRVKDNAQIAYYGDFGAYIRPEYFSIDRAQIEQGYTFNEVNFCKYLKN